MVGALGAVAFGTDPERITKNETDPTARIGATSVRFTCAVANDQPVYIGTTDMLGSPVGAGYFGVVGIITSAIPSIEITVANMSGNGINLADLCAASVSGSQHLIIGYTGN